MKERRRNIKKFTLLSDDLKMNESTKISLQVSTISGDQGFEEPPADKRDESTYSTTDRTTQSTTRTESSESSHKAMPKFARPVQIKKRAKAKQNQEAVIIPRRRKSRQLLSRTNGRASNNVILAVELGSDFHKSGSRGSKCSPPNTKERVLTHQDWIEPESPESIQIKCNAVRDINANRDRLFGGEPEAKPRRSIRRKRRLKPDDNSRKNVYWWIGTSEDEEPPLAVNKLHRPQTSNSNSVQQILSGHSSLESAKSLPGRNRRAMYKLRDDDTSTKLFGAPEVKKQFTKIRPGDASYNRLFGSESEGLPLTPRTNSVNGCVVVKNATRERLFGEKDYSSPRPLAKNFPDKLAHENIFSPTESITRGMKRILKASTVRNPIVGESALPVRTRKDSGIPSSNPITGEGYRPVKRDIHAVTCRI